MSIYCPIDLYGGGDARPSGGKGRKEGIALGVNFRPIVSGEAASDECVMVRQDACVGILADPSKQRGRALDVGEQKSQRLRGKRLRDRRSRQQDRCAGSLAFVKLVGLFFRLEQRPPCTHLGHRKRRE
jgi:hypothetical protein